VPQSKKVLIVDDEEIFAENQHCSCVLMTAHPADTVVADLVPPKAHQYWGISPNPTNLRLGVIQLDNTIRSPMDVFTTRMNRLWVTAALGLLLAIHANATGNEEQNKVAQCNQDGGDKIDAKTDDERKAAMKACLNAKKEPPYQAKLALCNARAKGLEGDERQRSMADCLKI